MGGWGGQVIVSYSKQAGSYCLPAMWIGIVCLQQHLCLAWNSEALPKGHQEVEFSAPHTILWGALGSPGTVPKLWLPAQYFWHSLRSPNPRACTRACTRQVQEGFSSLPRENTEHPLGIPGGRRGGTGGLLQGFGQLVQCPSFPTILAAPSPRLSVAAKPKPAGRVLIYLLCFLH